MKYFPLKVLALYRCIRHGTVVEPFLCSILGDNLRPVLPAIVQMVQKIICPLEDDGDEPTADGYGIAPIGAAVTITTGTELVLNITCDIDFVETMLNGVETYRDQDVRQKIQEYLDTICKSWGDALKAHQITYAVTVYVSRIIYSILTIQDVVNVSNVKINGAAGDLQLTEEWGAATGTSPRNGGDQR